jgi:tetratricopeptide (TPR) repeat protein
MATAWRLAYCIDAAEGRYDAAAAAGEQVIEHARAAGDVRQERRASVAYAQSVLYGSTTVDQAARRCSSLLTAVEGDRRAESLIQLSLAHLTAMRGDVEAARALYRGAQRMLNDLGRSVLSLSTSLDSAPVEVLARDYEAAERELRRDLADLDLIGETYLRSTVAGLLARVLALTGHGDEAEAIALDVQRMAADDDADAQVLWRSALALRRSEQGRPDEALVLVDEAVELSRAGSDPHRAAQSLTDRATVRAAAGRLDEASADLAAALEIHRAKGNVVETAAVEAQLASSLSGAEGQ